MDLSPLTPIPLFPLSFRIGGQGVRRVKVKETSGFFVPLQQSKLNGK